MTSRKSSGVLEQLWGDSPERHQHPAPTPSDGAPAEGGRTPLSTPAVHMYKPLSYSHSMIEGVRRLGVVTWQWVAGAPIRGRSGSRSGPRPVLGVNRRIGI